MADYNLLLSDTQETTIGTWATVTQASPLRIKVDGDSAQLGFTPDTLVPLLAVNDRVLVQVINRRVVVVGRTGGINLTSVLGMVYPVGAIYTSTVSTSPATLFGFGTWVAITDTFLLAAGSTYTAGTTGGEATHVLTQAEMPSHTHTLTVALTNVMPANLSSYPSGFNGNNAGTGTVTSGGPANTGGGGAHNNMPPYLVVYVWKRTA